VGGPVTRVVGRKSRLIPGSWPTDERPTSLELMTTAAISLPRDHSDLASVAKAGAVVAILDGTYAIVLYSWILHLTTSARIFQGIASRLIGKGSFEGGAATVALGVLLHFTVAYGWTSIYYVALRTFPGLRAVVESVGGKVVVGALLGAIVWPVMNFVIVPLFGGRSVSLSNWQFSSQLVWHMIAVGPPIVAIVRYRPA